LIATEPGQVRSSSGVGLMAHGLRAARGVTTLLVAGGEGVTTAMQCPRTLAFVRAAARRGCRVASVCSGSYLLAQAGLLNERRGNSWSITAVAAVSRNSPRCWNCKRPLAASDRGGKDHGALIDRHRRTGGAIDRIP
jgi:putative intracellular protease/amidase